MSVGDLARSARESMLKMRDELLGESNDSVKGVAKSRDEQRHEFSFAVSQVVGVVGASAIVYNMGSYFGGKIAEHGWAEGLVAAIDGINAMPVSVGVASSALIAVSAAAIYGSYKGAEVVFDKLLDKHDNADSMQLVNPEMILAEIRADSSNDRVSNHIKENFERYLQEESEREARKDSFAQKLNRSSEYNI